MILGKCLAFVLFVNVGFIYSALSQTDGLAEASTISKFNAFKINEFKGKNPCVLCFAFVPLIKELIAKNDTRAFKDIAVLVCVTLKITNDESVCAGAIELFEPSVLAVIKNTALTDIELCSAFLGNCGTIENPAFNWNITLPDVPKPPVKPINPPAVIFVH
jgi:hypothetical protein